MKHTLMRNEKMIQNAENFALLLFEIRMCESSTLHAHHTMQKRGMISLGITLERRERRRWQDLISHLKVPRQERTHTKGSLSRQGLSLSHAKGRIMSPMPKSPFFFIVDAQDLIKSLSNKDSNQIKFD